MRVCWNRQTGTFEGRVSLTYGFKSHHSHQKPQLMLRFFNLIKYVERWLSWSKAHDWKSCRR